MDFSDKSLGFCAYWNYSVMMVSDWTDEQRLSNWKNAGKPEWRDAWEAAANGAIAENEKRAAAQGEVSKTNLQSEAPAPVDFLKINAQFSAR